MEFFVQKLFTLFMKISLHVVSQLMHLLRSFYAGVSKKLDFVSNVKNEKGESCQ